MSFKDFTLIDIALTKMAVFFGTLFLFSIWSGFRSWVIEVNWIWFLIIAIVLSITPMFKWLKS